MVYGINVRVFYHILVLLAPINLCLKDKRPSIREERAAFAYCQNNNLKRFCGSNPTSIRSKRLFIVNSWPNLARYWIFRAS